MTWYFQGMERMRTAAILDVAGRVLGTIGIFLLVRTPDDGWKVLMLQGVAAGVSLAAGMLLGYREIGFTLPSLSAIRHTLRMGSSMFVFKSSVSLYTAGNAFILGLFASATSVGYYAGAEKITKGLAGMLMPATQAIYARQSHLVTESRTEAARLVRYAVLIMSLIACGMFAFLLLFAPYLVRVLLGPGYERSVAVLRMLAVLPILIAVSNVLGMQWMLPLRLDRQFNGVVISGGALNILLAIALAPHHGEQGMAIAVVASEMLVVVGLYCVLRILCQDPIFLQSGVERSAT